MFLYYTTSIKDWGKIFTKKDDDMFLSMEELADESIDAGEPENWFKSIMVGNIQENWELLEEETIC